jgi:hypothetical protein
MTDNYGSPDRSIDALDFIINMLKEHEQQLDNSFHEMATITEKVGSTIDGLKGKVGEAEEKISNLQKEVTNLIAYVSGGVAKGVLPAAIKKQTGQAAPSLALESTSCVILRCERWEDFQALAMHAQILTFSYEEDMTVFQANALKGNQLIIYVGAFPNFSIILKNWLSLQLDITELNILEGTVDSPK